MISQAICPRQNLYVYYNIIEQEAHGPLRSTEKQFQSINTFVQSLKFDYTITLIKRKAKLV